MWYENLGKNVFILSVYESLVKLKLEYVDLFLIYWFYFGDDLIMEDYLGSLKEVK